MGQLVNGVWIKGSVSNNQKDGSFKELIVYLEIK